MGCAVFILVFHLFMAMVCQIKFKELHKLVKILFYLASVHGRIGG